MPNFLLVPLTSIYADNNPVEALLTKIKALAQSEDLHIYVLLDHAIDSHSSQELALSANIAQLLTPCEISLVYKNNDHKIVVLPGKENQEKKIITNPRGHNNIFNLGVKAAKNAIKSAPNSSFATPQSSEITLVATDAEYQAFANIFAKQSSNTPIIINQINPQAFLSIMPTVASQQQIDTAREQILMAVQQGALPQMPAPIQQQYDDYSTFLFTQICQAGASIEQQQQHLESLRKLAQAGHTRTLLQIADLILAGMKPFQPDETENPYVAFHYYQYAALTAPSITLRLAALKRIKTLFSNPALKLATLHEHKTDNIRLFDASINNLMKNLSRYPMKNNGANELKKTFFEIALMEKTQFYLEILRSRPVSSEEFHKELERDSNELLLEEINNRLKIFEKKTANSAKPAAKNVVLLNVDDTLLSQSKELREQLISHLLANNITRIYVIWPEGFDKTLHSLKQSEAVWQIEFFHQLAICGITVKAVLTELDQYYQSTKTKNSEPGAYYDEVIKPLARTRHLLKKAEAKKQKTLNNELSLQKNIVTAQLQLTGDVILILKFIREWLIKIKQLKPSQDIVACIDEFVGFINPGLEKIHKITTPRSFESYQDKKESAQTSDDKGKKQLAKLQSKKLLTQLSEPFEVVLRTAKNRSFIQRSEEPIYLALDELNTLLTQSIQMLESPTQNGDSLENYLSKPVANSNEAPAPWEFAVNKDFFGKGPLTLTLYDGEEPPGEEEEDDLTVQYFPLPNGNSLFLPYASQTFYAEQKDQQPIPMLTPEKISQLVEATLPFGPQKRDTIMAEQPKANTSFFNFFSKPETPSAAQITEQAGQGDPIALKNMAEAVLEDSSALSLEFKQKSFADGFALLCLAYYQACIIPDEKARKEIIQAFIGINGLFSKRSQELEACHFDVIQGFKGSEGSYSLAVTTAGQKTPTTKSIKTLIREFHDAIEKYVANEKSYNPMLHAALTANIELLNMFAQAVPITHEQQKMLLQCESARYVFRRYQKTAVNLERTPPGLVQIAHWLPAISNKKPSGAMTPSVNRREFAEQIDTKPEHTFRNLRN